MNVNLLGPGPLSVAPTTSDALSGSGLAAPGDSSFGNVLKGAISH